MFQDMISVLSIPSEQSKIDSMAKAKFIISSSFQAPDILPNKLAHVLEQLREQKPLLKFLTEKDGNFDCHPL